MAVTPATPPRAIEIIARASRCSRTSTSPPSSMEGRRAGRKAIGYLPVYVPRELIHAAGMLPVGILGGGDSLEIIQGDAFYQSYICHIPRSHDRAGAHRPARLPRRHALPVHLRRDPQPLRHVADPVPGQATSATSTCRRTSTTRSAATSAGRSSRSCATTSGACAGRRSPTRELSASIAVYNDNRAAVRELYAYRAAKPWQVPTSELYLLLRAGMVLPPEEHTLLVREYLRGRRRAPRPQRDNARVVLTGSFCEQPPLGLIKTIERAGCYIVDDDFMLVTAGCATTCRPTAIRWPSCRRRSCTARRRPPPSTTRSARTRASSCWSRCKTRGAEGVIFAAPSFCDPALLDRPMLQDVAGAAEDPLHRVQVRREHRPVAADPRAGRHLRRLDQALERSMRIEGAAA